MVIAVVLPGAVLLLFGALTGLGERRRGGSAPVVALAALVFPVAWAVWHLRDERPYGRLTRPAA
ncbi:hypothetical protein [Nocardioides nitrophenolicus]|uniref:hypothetical protein n=1 Tax=Nocardioides nitrophenolicus TaxID=60489 RepID=UPI00196067F7|nr:hypothetical protein [Nocardioides nitrophenolicus]MBM7515205.1 hypothetical protein [Nocardioides nitrophenolicus]